MKCKGCGGTGWVDNWVMGLGNSPEECQRCKGTGEVKSVKTKPVDHMGEQYDSLNND